MAIERTIRVTGKGKLKVRPDMTRITITLEGVKKEYSSTLKQSSEDTEELKKILKKHDFSSEDVKTLSFNVEVENESYHDKNGDWKSRFVGYRFRHVLKVDFVSDNDRLGKILYSLANALIIHPEFRISFFVKDETAAKNELLGKAVKDSRDKAEILTAAAGVKLGDIQTIDYSWGQINMEIAPMHMDMLCCETAKCSTGGYDMDIEPDDIDITDTVTVVWGIC
ncbi:SIMPL domain-containing protein [Butyrivibrio sp. AC2005]|uniref:SIMPL domain-containing protein n=1 Tax=Butyrivibrio sp. AC2005 TaxID=1280672 RepID=UPI00041FBEE8|nr:SIMPL domain-containing protein [Butyrivibrio sp. AC2005]